MAKSPALIQKLKSFADKLTGTTRVNNAANPGSAYNMSLRKSANTPPTTTPPLKTP